MEHVWVQRVRNRRIVRQRQCAQCSLWETPYSRAHPCGEPPDQGGEAAREAPTNDLRGTS